MQQLLSKCLKKILSRILSNFFMGKCYETNFDITPALREIWQVRRDILQSPHEKYDDNKMFIHIPVIICTKCFYYFTSFVPDFGN